MRRLFQRLAFLWQQNIFNAFLINFLADEWRGPRRELGASVETKFPFLVENLNLQENGSELKQKANAYKRIYLKFIQI